MGDCVLRILRAIKRSRVIKPSSAFALAIPIQAIIRQHAYTHIQNSYVTFLHHASSLLCCISARISTIEYFTFYPELSISTRIYLGHILGFIRNSLRMIAIKRVRDTRASAKSSDILVECIYRFGSCSRSNHAHAFWSGWCWSCQCVCVRAMRHRIE